jgi:hypothetical protein
MDSVNYKRCLTLTSLNRLQDDLLYATSGVTFGCAVPRVADLATIAMSAGQVVIDHHFPQ